MKERGFTLIAVMLALVLLALATQGVMFVVSQQAQREREAELLRIGQELVRGIASYYEATPGSVKVFPATLKDLEEDRRFVTVKRHVRRLYGDPMSAGQEWEAIRQGDGGIQGVHSRSHSTPIRTASIDLGDLQLPEATRYSDWKFVYVPMLAAPASGR